MTGDGFMMPFCISMSKIACLLPASAGFGAVPPCCPE
jgi:hypothetical protein